MTILRAVALCAITAGLAFSQPQTLLFDGGRDDRPGRIGTDNAANVYLTGSISNLTKASSFAVTKYSQAGSLQWSSFYAAQTGEFGGGSNKVAVDTAGNSYATGNILLRVGTIGSNLQWLVVSFSPTGVQRWAHKIIGADGGTVASASTLVLDPAGGVYVAGITGSISDWLVVKYNSTGSVLWQYRLAGSGAGSDIPVQMSLDPAGNLIVTGMTVNASSGTSGRHDITVAKFTPGGILSWRRDYSDGDLADDIAGAVAVDASGNIYVTGTTGLDPESAVDTVLVKWDSNGNRQFAFKGVGYGGQGIAVDADGNIVVSGASMGAAGSAGVAATAKFDASGNRLWMTNLQAGGEVAVDVNRNVYVGGSIFNSGGSDPADFGAAKLSPTGVLLWNYRYVPGGFVTGTAFTVAGDWLVGGTQPSANGGDIAVLKFPAGFTPPPPAPPPAPASLTASASSRNIALQWQDRSSNEDGFRVERCQGAGCSNFVQITQLGANATSFVDAALPKSTVFTYRVRAFNANGNSTYSNVASAKTGK